MFLARIRVLFTFLVFSSVCLRVAAQDSVTGSMRGIVTDFGGALISQATVVVVNNATGVRYVATSDAEGCFAMELPPGEYSARVEAPGMSPEITPQLHIDVGGTAQIAFHLKIAGAQESMTVSAAPLVVETL